MGGLCAKEGEPKSTKWVEKDCQSYFGSCWLLAPSRDSFSPSRWFPLSPSTLEGRRGDRRAFSISEKQMTSKERKKISFLVENKVSVPEGLDVTGYNKIVVTTLSGEEIKGKKSVMVGGTHVRLPSTSDEPSGLTIMATKRLELEMNPPQYATRHYTRHRISAPPQSEEDRRTIGEGCITGVEFGGYIVLKGDCPFMAKRIVKLLQEKSTPDIVIGQENAAGNKSKSEAPPTDFYPEMVDSEGELNTSGGSLESITESILELFKRPEKWRITALFLQRYEAIGCLLT